MLYWFFSRAGDAHIAALSQVFTHPNKTSVIKKLDLRYVNVINISANNGRLLNLCYKSDWFCKHLNTSLFYYEGYTFYRPFASCPKPLFYSKAINASHDMKMIFYSHTNKTHFQSRKILQACVAKWLTPRTP